jgi:phospholipase C
VPVQMTNIFVLMLENRSFDHVLGFSGITGIDAEAGAPTIVRGLVGTESNSYRGQVYTVSRGADETMPVDPGHEFLDVLEELAGRTPLICRAGTIRPSITAVSSVTMPSHTRKTRVIPPATTARY